MQNPLGIKSWNPLKSQIPLGVFPPLGAQSGPDPKSGNFLGFLGGIFWEFFVPNPRPIPKSGNFLGGQFFHPNPWIKFSCKDFFSYWEGKSEFPIFWRDQDSSWWWKMGMVFFGKSLEFSGNSQIPSTSLDIPQPGSCGIFILGSSKKLEKEGFCSWLGWIWDPSQIHGNSIPNPPQIHGISTFNPCNSSPELSQFSSQNNSFGFSIPRPGQELEKLNFPFFPYFFFLDGENNPVYFME